MALTNSGGRVQQSTENPQRPERQGYGSGGLAAKEKSYKSYLLITSQQVIDVFNDAFSAQVDKSLSETENREWEKLYHRIRDFVVKNLIDLSNKSTVFKEPTYYTGDGTSTMHTTGGIMNVSPPHVDEPDRERPELPPTTETPF